jgi:subtilisin family serine protease
MTHSLRRLVVGALVCAATWFVTASGQEPTVQSPRNVPNELIVEFKPQSAQSRRDAISTARGARVLRRLENIHRVRVATGTNLDAEIAALANDPDVLAVQPNFIREITLTPNDAYWTSNSLWGLLKIQAPSAWTISTGSQQVIVADIDTGVNYTHPDLAQNMWRNPGEIAGNGIDDDANGYVDDVYGIDAFNGDSDPMDDHSHGSHTSGTIGAIGNNTVGVVGVNWNVRILACKAFGANGSGTDVAAIECFNYITALKKKGINIRVSSSSWGSARTSFPQAMKNAIDAAGAAGIVNVFAAGNFGTNNDATPFDPASIDSPGSMSVAASDSLDGRASFSNYGATSVDIAAPGVSIVSTGITGYLAKSGTSMATPHVAGVAALVSGLKPTLTPAGIRTLIMNSADPLGNWSGIVASGGRLNAYLAALDSGGDIAPTVGLTSPVNGATFSAPATIAIAGTASDADGTVSKVDFYANGAFIGSDTTSPYSVSWTNVGAGAYNLTAVATDNRLFTTTSTAVAVTVTASVPPPAPPATRVNVALAANGGRATASSTYGTNYAPSTVNNGDRKGAPWGNGGGWNETTPGVFPDWVRIDFAGSKAIDEVDVISVQDAYLTPIEPTSTLLFTRYGLTSFQVEYWNGNAWVSVPGGAITGNRNVLRQLIFAPVTTTAIRILITGTMDGWSRLVEVEAYSGGAATPPPPPPPPPPTGRTNVALASNGGVATASSTYAASYSPSTVLNGDRKGSSWGNGGGWSEQTPGVYPDWVRVDFAGAKTIDEVGVFTVQDNYTAPIEPTATLLFSRYGLTNFQLEYWTGTTWSAVPGAIANGNRNVWRKFTFAPVTTTSIRIVITGTMDGWARITELEVYGTGTSGPPASALIGFPPDNWWNLDISSAPVDVNSASYISFIGSTRTLHPDFGGPYGLPYIVVNDTTPRVAVQFGYSAESDGVDHATNVSFPFYPIPPQAITERFMIEGAEPGNVDLRAVNDRHMLIVNKDKRHLYELWNVFFDGATWRAGSGAFFDMNTNNRRTEGWTSADAAGLAVLPGLVRYDEAFGTDEIRHAFRVTVRATNGYVFPASHRAGSTAGALPMGARLRLKASKNLASFPPELQRVFRAMQRYGLIVADNGTDMFITGAYDSRWNNDVMNSAFRLLTAADFEVISLGYRS